MLIQLGFKTRVFLISLDKIKENGTVRILVEYYFARFNSVIGNVPDYKVIY